MTNMQLDLLGENLGPCPCCHRAELKIRTLSATKGITSLVRNGNPFLLRVRKELLYVDRTHKVWARGDEDRYIVPRGTIRDFVDIAPPKVKRKKKAKKAK